MSTAICWFRRDLRLGDNPAWDAATTAEAVVALYIYDSRLLDGAGPFRRRSVLAAVEALAAELAELGGRLTTIGPTDDVAAALGRAVELVGADVIHADADVTPYATARDRRADETLAVPIEWHWGNLVHRPGSVLTAKGTLSQVFTPFSKRWFATALPDRPPAGSAQLAAPEGGDPLLHPDTDPPRPAGTDAAHARLARFCEIVDDYPELRDLPGESGTSEISTDLKLGVLGPREVLEIVGTHSPGREAFVRQLAWRDWYAHHLLARPEVVDRAVRSDYDAIVWRDDEDGFRAWTEGRTGYPIVDAGMRQLAETGWMHNRVRMIVASFLVKDLLIDWRRGERWFRHLLTDADVPQNVGNWQWAAGTGHDAAPYFRIFNPVSQSERFDPDGTYIRRWVPELAGVDANAIHAPWEAAPLDLAAAGVVLGDTYPAPIVDHKDARDRTLAAYKAAVS